MNLQSFLLRLRIVDADQMRHRSQHYSGAMKWLDITTAPFDRDLELAVIGPDGQTRSVAFACRRVLGGWIKAATMTRLNIHPTHWRAWDRTTLALSAK